jgi:hypothetical protein
LYPIHWLVNILIIDILLRLYSCLFLFFLVTHISNIMVRYSDGSGFVKISASVSGLFVCFPVALSLHHCSAMELEDFDDATFGDPATCGGYSHLSGCSEGEESDDDYQTPKQKAGNIMMEHLWSQTTKTSDVSSTAASSSLSSGTAVVHPPLDLAQMFANASLGDSETFGTDSKVDTRYSIAECPPIDCSTLEERLDWVFTYAIRVDKPWLNFPYKRGNKRCSVKQLDFSFLIRQYLDNKSFGWDVKPSWKVRRTAFDRMRGWYSRAYGVGAKKVSTILAAKWLEMRPEEIARWVFITRLEQVLYEPASYKQKRQVRIPLPSGEKISSHVFNDEDPIVANSVAMLLTYNTKVGHDDPTVLRWLQEGCKGDILFEKMMKHDLYKDVFEDFWQFQLALGEKLGFVNTAVCMEWSRFAEFPARVHLHVYHAPGLRFRSWDHHTPNIEIRQKCLLWKGRRPDLKPCFVKNRYKSAAVGTGLYYVSGKKSGTMYQKSTIQPFKDF